MNAKLMNEYQLIKQCIKGDKNAQYKLYDTHKVFLWGICLRYSKRTDEAEDMLQEGFIQIFKDLKQYSGDGSLKAWMHRVMVNSALTHIRRHRKKSFNELNETLDNDQNVVYPKLPELNDANVANALIRRLPEPYQTIFNLKAMEEYSFKEIQDLLKLNQSTLRSYYHRAKKKLRELYKTNFDYQKKNDLCKI